MAVITRPFQGKSPQTHDVAVMICFTPCILAQAKHADRENQRRANNVHLSTSENTHRLLHLLQHAAEMQKRSNY